MGKKKIAQLQAVIDGPEKIRPRAMGHMGTQHVPVARKAGKRYQAGRSYRLGVAERNLSGKWIHDRTPAACGSLKVVPVASGQARAERWFLKSTDTFIGGCFNG